MLESWASRQAQSTLGLRRLGAASAVEGLFHGKVLEDELLRVGEVPERNCRSPSKSNEGIGDADEMGDDVSTKVPNPFRPL